MKPNLFDIATSELSQDAFFSWLFKWANKSNKNLDPNLHELATLLINELITKQIPDFNDDILEVTAELQADHIDILIIVNGNICIIIEDKTSTKIHNDQLKRYKEEAKKRCKGKKKIFIYLKTGSESKISLKNIEKNEGYFVVSRKEIIKLFNPYKGKIKNDIFNDFIEHLNSIEEREKKFKSNHINKWDVDAWIGFYQFLEDNLGENNLGYGWDYVNNFSGGFYAFDFNRNLSWSNFPVYMQIEQNDLCFKISTDIDDKQLDQSDIRNTWYNILIDMAHQQGFNKITKPKRFGKGNYMTVAIIERKFWLGKDNEGIDEKIVIKNLKKYISFFNNLVEKANKGNPYKKS